MHSSAENGAITRITKALLNKPAFKNGLRNVLNNIEPDNAREFIRVLVWEDPELTLALVGAIPSMVNSVIKALDEVLLQVMEKFPPEIRKSLAEDIVHDIDKESLGRAMGNLSTLINELSPIFSELSAGKKAMKGGENE